MTLKEAEDFINSVPWVFSKEYKDTLPHYYTTRDRVNNDSLFEDFLKLVRKEGKLKTFFKKQYIYLEVNGYEYWEMGRPIKAVQVINRCQIDDEKHYRFPKATIEDEQLLKSKLLQREIYLEELLKTDLPVKAQQKQIDFLLNSTRRIHGGGKNIIDNSKLQVRYE